MNQPVLYLLIGYPGAGKTAVSRIIAEATGAVHVWADVERHKLFKRPTHAQAESLELYDRLNRQTGELLAAGKSVVFDTNFNFYRDRQKLRDIAARAGARTVIVWVVVPVGVAKRRAVNAPGSRNGYAVSMSEQRFDAIVAKLEPPRKDEKVIKIDGTNLDREQVTKLLQ